MKADEKRIEQLLNNPDNDHLLEEDFPLIRAGLLVLSWTERDEGRCHPFVTPDPTAVKYLQKNGRLTPAHRRTLKELAQKLSRSDVAWARTHIQPTYEQ